MPLHHPQPSAYPVGKIQWLLQHMLTSDNMWCAGRKTVTFITGLSNQWNTQLWRVNRNVAMMQQRVNHVVVSGSPLDFYIIVFVFNQKLETRFFAPRADFLLAFILIRGFREWSSLLSILVECRKVVIVGQASAHGRRKNASIIQVVECWILSCLVVSVSDNRIAPCIIPFIIYRASKSYNVYQIYTGSSQMRYNNTFILLTVRDLTVNSLQVAAIDVNNFSVIPFHIGFCFCFFSGAVVYVKSTTHMQYRQDLPKH